MYSKRLLVAFFGLNKRFMMESQSLSTTTAATKTRKAKVHNYVFGYGSLICPDSRSRTNPALAKKEPLPVVIQDVERVWSARTTTGFTATGVRFRKGAECTGVLLEVSPQELLDLDKREASYNRLPIHLDNIEQIDFLEEEDYYENDHPVFDAKESDNDDTHAKVWIYMQKEPIHADSSHPIPQSYVDIIIRGCLTISEDFARSFIETTKGWKHDEDHWVDDRDVPIYSRADSEFSNANADKIDKLIEEHKPEALEERVEYDPVEHLEALADALEEDKAHPRAIKHIVKRVKEVTSNDDLKQEAGSHERG